MSASPDIQHIVGHVLRQLREAKGLSQEAVGHAAGLHRTYVSSSERGARNISVRALDRWLGALDLTWSEFGACVSRDVAKSVRSKRGASKSLSSS